MQALSLCPRKPHPTAGPTPSSPLTATQSPEAGTSWKLSAHVLQLQVPRLPGPGAGVSAYSVHSLARGLVHCGAVGRQELQVSVRERSAVASLHFPASWRTRCKPGCIHGPHIRAAQAAAQARLPLLTAGHCLRQFSGPKPGRHELHWQVFCLYVAHLVAAWSPVHCIRQPPQVQEVVWSACAFTLTEGKHGPRLPLQSLPINSVGCQSSTMHHPPPSLYPRQSLTAMQSP